MQMRYIPGLAKLREYSADATEPHNIPLWLPSAIGDKLPCDPRFYSFEWDLRYAQANEALQEIRRNLQLRSHLYKHKDRFITGQRANTRSNATISRVQTYINGSAARYRTARKALVRLAPQLKKDNAWTASLLELHDEDIRAMTVGLDEESEGRRSLSWIWKQEGTALDGDKLHECKQPLKHLNTANLIAALRVEWCKARARAQRWSEEVRLLLEEMRRVLQFLNWRATFWETHAGFLQCDLAAAAHNTNELLGNSSLLSARIEGTQAYAHRQAHIQRVLHTHCRTLWHDVPSLVISEVCRDFKTSFALDRYTVSELSLAASFLN